jgi:hypothetical protein
LGGGIEMAVTLILEDGTGVDNANTYILLVDARTLAGQYGWQLPVDDEQANITLINGYNYLNTLESGMCGTRSYEDQTGAFPRENCSCGPFPIASDVIKPEVKQAQVRAAVTFGAGTDVNPDSDGKNIASEEVTGAVKVSYFNNGKTGGSVKITEAIQFLERCYLTSANGINFKTVRG